jgi:hypothetical protein
MAQQNIDFGTFPDDPDADAIRTAFAKVQNNFDQIFAGLEDQAVLSVNKTPGQGITVSSPTGNVVVSANLYQVNVESSGSNLVFGVGAPGGLTFANINSAAQTLFINLSDNIEVTGNVTANRLIGNNLSIANSVSIPGNISANDAVIANSVTANLLQGTLVANSSAQPNITSVGTLISLAVSGNASAGNINGGNLVTANFFTGTLTTNSQPNITSVGTLTSLGVSGNITAANITANTGIFSGNGSGLTNLTGANVTGTVANATHAQTSNTVVDNAQPNITSVGTLTSLAVTGNLSAGNVGGGNLVSANFLTGTLTTPSQPNVTSLGTLTGLDVNGNITAANITANTGVFTGNGSGLSALPGGNVTGTVANAAFAANAEFANTAGTVTTNAQPNITSVGTLVSLAVNGNLSAANISTTGSLSVTGNANVGNIGATNGVFTNVSGDGGGLSNIAGANITGTVANATYAANADHANTANTVTTASQPNITSVGTLTSLAVSGNLSAGNINAGNLMQANFIQGDGYLLSNISVGTGSYIENGNSNVFVNANSNVDIKVTNTAVGNFNVNGLSMAGNISAVNNITANNITASNWSNANLFAGTLFTPSQPNITTVGTLTGLTVSGVTNLGNVGNVIITGGSANYFLMTNGSGNLTWNNATLQPVAGANTQIQFNDEGNFAGSANFTFNKSTNLLTVAGNISANVVTANTIAGLLTTANQPNIVEVGTLGYLIISGNLNVGNILTAPTVNANTINANFVGGNGNSLFNIQAANIVGSVATANVANTVNDNAQPNITSVGTLTSLVVGSPNVSNFLNAKLISSSANTGNTETSILGIVGEGVATGSTDSIGVLGVGKTSGSLRGTGVQGVGVVNNTNDTAAAVGVRGYSTGAHTNGYNIGVLANAANSGVGNYGLYIQSGDIATIETDLDWDLFDNVTSALSFDSTDKTGILAINTNNGSESVSMSGSLSVTGNASVGAIKTDSYLYANGNPVDFQQTAGSNTQVQFNDNDSFGGSAAFTFNKLSNVVTIGGNIAATYFKGDGSTLGNITAANVVGTVANATHACTANTVTNAIQSNIVTVGTLTNLTVSGNITSTSGIYTGNGNGLTDLNASNLSVGTIPSARLSGNYTINVTNATNAVNVTGNSQPNITGVGTLTTLTVSGNINAGNVSANNGVFNNVTGTLTTASQPNITTIGTLSSLTVTGNVNVGNISATSFYIRSISSSITANGANSQGDATVLTKEINIITTASGNVAANYAGVRLPNNIAGMVLIITNNSANVVNVWPAAGSQIRPLSTNSSMALAVGSTLQFICADSTSWYTVGATYA